MEEVEEEQEEQGGYMTAHRFCGLPRLSQREEEGGMGEVLCLCLNSSSSSSVLPVVVLERKRRKARALLLGLV